MLRIFSTMAQQPASRKIYNQFFSPMAQVIAENECTFISINTDELSILFKRDPELKIVFMSSLTNALVAKLIAQQSQVSDLSGYSSFASMVSNYFDQGGG